MRHFTRAVLALSCLIALSGVSQAQVVQYDATITNATGQSVIGPQRVSASNPLPVTGSLSVGGLAQGSTTSGQSGGLTLCATTTAAPTYVTATTNPCNTDTAGDIRVIDANSAALLTAAQAAIPAGTADIGSVQLWAQPANWVSGTLTSAMTGTTDTSLIAAPGANLNNYLVTIVCGNAHATVSTGINIKDGSGGTVIAWVPAAAVYGGTAVNFNVPLKQPTANTALYVADDTTGASVKCTATGFKR